MIYCGNGLISEMYIWIKCWEEKLDPQILLAGNAVHLMLASIVLTAWGDMFTALHVLWSCIRTLPSIVLTNGPADALLKAHYSTWASFSTLDMGKVSALIQEITILWFLLDIPLDIINYEYIGVNALEKMIIRCNFFTIVFSLPVSRDLKLPLLLIYWIIAILMQWSAKLSLWASMPSCKG
jgi:hypothetical protein